tara:strand:- start:167 stop:994 length:828 start_codon:yes stop_codon:yes gene_type:complete
MFEKIYINGCSYVAGAGLPFHHLAWEDVQGDVGKLLQSELGAEWIRCDAKGGCSNDRIRRTTIDFVLKNLHLKNLLVVVGWTQFTRFELFDELESSSNRTPNNYIQLNSGLAHTKYSKESFFDNMRDRITNPMGKMIRFGTGKDHHEGKIQSFKKFWETYMMRHYNLEDMYEKYLDNILYTQFFLESNNISYIMFDSLWSINEEKLYNKFLQKRQQINFDKWVWGEGKLSWTEYLSKIDPESKKTRVGKWDDHPNQYGHKIWFELVSQKVKELYG